jgi:hypothetical protein
VRARRRCKGTELTTDVEKDRGDFAGPYHGFGDWGNGGVGPAVKRRRQRWRCSVSGDWGRGEERRRGAANALRRSRGGGEFYWAGEAVGRRGGGQCRLSFTPHRFRRS